MLKKLFRLGAVGLAALHLARLFLPAEPSLLVFVVSLAVLGPGLVLMGKGFRKATIVFLVLGAVLLATARAPIPSWISAWISMTNIVAIMVTLQLFSIPVAMGRYDDVLRDWANRHFKSDRSLFVFSTTITHVLTSFLMLGAIPVSMALLGKTVKARVSRYERYISTAISRGYVLAAMWAPGAINLYLVVQATGLAWSSILAPGFILALLALGLSYAMEVAPGGVLERRAAAIGPSRAGERAIVPEKGGDASTTPTGVDSSSAGHVLMAAVGIVALVFVFERAKFGAGYSRIMLAGSIVAAAWMLLLHRSRRFGVAAGEYWRDGLMKVVDMGPFFVAMGFFSGALEFSGLLEAARPTLQAAATWLGPAAVAVLPLVIIALSLAGLHPFITIVLFGKILAHAGMALPPVTIALALAAGGAAAYMISPFAGIIMSLARYTGARAVDVAVAWNWKFSLAFFAMAVLFALGWGMLFA